jgi:RimJ/RimL family protein N-acetyltransferase
MSAAAAECLDPCLTEAATTVVLRPLEPEDGHLLVDIFDRLSSRSRESRFLAAKHRLTDSDLRRLTAVDHVHHEALLALSVEDGRPVGVARFARDDEHPEAAEVAVTVVDAWQDQGVGTLLASALTARAREVGITRFNALMLPDNEPAARLMHHTAGEVERVALDHHGAEFVITLTPALPRARRRLLKGV